ncbi:MAG: YlxR family protein [Streptococcaceae bacterium]|jgi:predicted RNA-binding protein YlxR (DUF448 family)|nr:YlxR family protein [Streptococcaceae bacterium]
MKKQRKIPMRKSVVSGEMFPKKELLRIARNKEGVVSIDPTGKAPGRGAYIALNPEEVKLSQQKGILQRSLEAKISDEFYEELLNYVIHQQARKELFKDEQ